MQPGDSFEVATSATVTVYNRRGTRLGTVYLAHPPELGQQTMTEELTSLIERILAGWEGPTPYLSYVTDAGDHETAYYQDVLRPMRHPQSGQPIAWQRIVDYYHASQRITTLAEALFGLTRSAESWARRMRKLLLKRNGPSRVLHAAAARAQPSPRHRTSQTRLSPSVCIPSYADQVHAVLGISAAPSADRQRSHRGRLQDRVHATFEVIGDAVEARRCQNRAPTPSDPAEWDLGRCLRHGTQVSMGRRCKLTANWLVTKAELRHDSAHYGDGTRMKRLVDRDANLPR